MVDPLPIQSHAPGIGLIPLRVVMVIACIGYACGLWQWVRGVYLRQQQTDAHAAWVAASMALDDAQYGCYPMPEAMRLARIEWARQQLEAAARAMVAAETAYQRHRGSKGGDHA